MTATPRHVELPRLKRKHLKKVVDRLLRKGYSLRLTPKEEAGRFDRRG